MVGKTNKSKSRIPVKKDMRDYSNDPNVIASAERATAFLKKHGLPEPLRNKSK
jgi:hypothetical protein